LIQLHAGGGNSQKKLFSFPILLNPLNPIAHFWLHHTVQCMAFASIPSSGLCGKPWHAWVWCCQRFVIISL